MKFCKDNRTPDTVIKYPLTCEEINKYYVARSHLFYTVIHNEQHQMSDDNVVRFIKKYVQKVRKECKEVPDRMTPHMFRHSRALQLYQKGVPLPLISEWLGHSNRGCKKFCV